MGSLPTLSKKLPLTHIINQLIQTGIVPYDFKSARVTLLWKKPYKLEVGNYCLISVLPVISKLSEKAVYCQVEYHLLEHNLVYEMQSGFQQNYSTNLCLIFIIDYIKSEISKGNLVGMVTLDAPKAFDCANHVLCSKLELTGLGINLV